MSDAQVVAIFNAISQHMARLQPMLEQVRVKEWVAKGAPDAYLQQLASIGKEIQAIEADMARLAQRPDQMQDCMRGLFRVQALHVPLHSLMGGLRRYQNPALADLIESVAAEDQTQVARLEQYVLELADAKDQQYNVVDKEAQRCRAMLSREPAPRAKATHNQ
jgi:ABC-type transport system involved in cytochrome bd biosynthesis fused ATPase/permease subunit